MNEIGLGADPAEALADHGFGDLSPDALSSALVHFVERAPMEMADALAPIVTRVSPVPFTEGDLPPVPEADAIIDSGGDALALLNEVGLADPDPSGGIDEVSSLIDEAAEGLGQVEQVEQVEQAGDVADEAEELVESTFGVGGEEIAELIETPEVEDLAGALDQLDDGTLDRATEAAEDAIADELDGFDIGSFTDVFDQNTGDQALGTDPADFDDFD